MNLVDWLKVMVGSRCFEEVVDLTIETKPPTTALKRALLATLICVDPDAEKIPIMSQVARILESEEYPVSRKGSGLNFQKLNLFFFWISFAV